MPQIPDAHAVVERRFSGHPPARGWPLSAEFRESARNAPRTRSRVGSTSAPWSHSLPTTWLQGGHLAGWSSSGRTFSAGQTPRTAAVRDYPTTGSLRVLSRKRRRGLARNGPLGAAIGNSGWVSARSAGPPVMHGPLRDDDDGRAKQIGEGLLKASDACIAASKPAEPATQGV